MIVIHATFSIDPDARDEALDALADLAAASRDEDGVIDYRATTEIDAPNTVRIVEQYDSQSSFEAHLDTDHYRRYSEQSAEFVTGDKEVFRLAVDSVEEL